MATSAYLGDEDEQKARKLVEEGEFESISEVVKEGLNLLENKLKEARLAEKYRRETPVSEAESEAQAKTLSDLDG
jgi:putative addiction module CopG family antidote